MTVHIEFGAKSVVEARDFQGLIFRDADNDQILLDMPDCREKIRKLVREWDFEDEVDARESDERGRRDLASSYVDHNHGPMIL